MPKTGGTSTEAYLSDQYDLVSVFPKFKYNNFGVIDLECMKYYNLIMGHFDVRLLSYLPANCIKATIFREPISLTISAVKHAMLDSNFCPPGIDLEGKNLQQIIRDESLIRKFCNIQTSYLSSLPYFRSYPDISEKDYLFDSITLSLSAALSNLKQFDFVGIFEEFDESLNLLAELCGLHQPRIKPRLNISLSNSDNVLTTEELEIVRNYNKLDIKLYQEARNLYLTYQQTRKTQDIKRNIKSFSLETGINYISEKPFCGYGFHSVEYAEKGCYRWTGSETLSGITFDGSCIAACEFTVEYCFQDNYASKINFYINGQLTEAVIFDTFGLLTAKIFYVNSLSYNGPIDLEFKADVVVSTAIDLRKRGLIVTNISVTSFDLLEVDN